MRALVPRIQVRCRYLSRVDRRRAVGRFDAVRATPALPALPTRILVCALRYATTCTRAASAPSCVMSRLVPQDQWPALTDAIEASIGIEHQSRMPWSALISSHASGHRNPCRHRLKAAAPGAARMRAGRAALSRTAGRGCGVEPRGRRENRTAGRVVTIALQKVHGWRLIGWAWRTIKRPAVATSRCVPPQFRKHRGAGLCQ